VPHIVIPGSGRFQLVLVRTAAGTHFSDVAPEVKAVFVLMGTADERNATEYATADTAMGKSPIACQNTPLYK
jgi:hypothetical protein